MKKKKVIFGSVILCVIILLAVVYVYINDDNLTTFKSRVSVNGQDVSGMTAQQAEEELNAVFMNTSVILSENNEQIYETTLQDAGYFLDTDKMMKRLESLIKRQSSGINFFKRVREYEVEYDVAKSDEAFTSVFTVAAFTKVRTDSADAYLTYDKEQNLFVIVPETQGNNIEDAVLQGYVEEQLEKSFSENPTQGEIDIAIDPSLYIKPNVVSTDASLAAQLDAYNQEAVKYQNVEITYLFGNETQVLDADIISTWMIAGDSGVQLSEEMMRDYISDMAAKYNTIYNDRDFVTTGGQTVPIQSNEYGYRIDQDAEYEQLVTELSAGQPVQREPVYSKQGYHREGVDDLAGSYIEVSLDAQHLWLYKDGALVTETDIVSGLPTAERETYRGAWPIAYKASPYTLTSDIYGYSAKVSYWMPFVYGQGLHDATWKSNFGGDEYKTGGSHGCINLPLDQAAIIYETIDQGYPILIY